MNHLKQYGFIALFLAIALGGAWLRLHSANTRQMHTDEGVQAYQAWKLIETGEYRYDAEDRHGPTLYYFTAWASPLISNEKGELTDQGVRLIPFIFSMAMLVAIYLFRSELGNAGTLFAAALVAFSPLQIIYGSYFIQESSLALFTFIFAWSLWRVCNQPSTSKWIGLGLVAGLMFTTKETSIIHFAAMAPFALAAFGIGKPLSTSKLLKGAAISLASFALVYLIFFSSLFTHWGGLSDALSALVSYADRAGGQGHEKSWGYYLGIFLPHTKEGIYWSELTLLLLFAISVGHHALRLTSLVKQKLTGQYPLPVLLSLSGLTMFLIYSFVPYKTPWLMLTPHLFLCIGAGATLHAGIGMLYKKLERTPHMLTLVLTILILTVASRNVDQIRYSVFRYHSDARNPYIYQHTANPFGKLVSRLRDLDTHLPDEKTIGVFSPDAAWPLPWYLRNRDQVAYHTDLASLGQYDFELLDTRLPQAVPEDYFEGAMYEMHGLRPNTLLTLRMDEVLWERYMDRKDKTKKP